jgi:hypothetical protein
MAARRSQLRYGDDCPHALFLGGGSQRLDDGLPEHGRSELAGFAVGHSLDGWIDKQQRFEVQHEA